MSPTRDWASEALRDERQVHARSTTSPDGKLVLLADGAAEELRAVAQAGELVCPVPEGSLSAADDARAAVTPPSPVHRQAPGDPDHHRRAAAWREGRDAGPVLGFSAR